MSKGICVSEITPGYAGTRWPWHIEVTCADGTVREYDYEPDNDAAGYARFLSAKPGVTQVNLTTVFIGGEQVSPVEKPESDHDLPR
jgi:hypothetical protein